jgi:hypothetical protein
MSRVAGTIPASVNRLVDEYRHRCLWFLRSDYYPETDAQRLQVLEYIEFLESKYAPGRAAA